MNTNQPQSGFFDNVSVYFDQASSFTVRPREQKKMVEVKEYHGKLRVRTRQNIIE
jgi:hypothetical protein